MDRAARRHAALVAGLRGELARLHGEVSLVETHISSVLLAGDRAYKVKKPVDLGFLDFHTLGRRRRCCQAELALNRRLAPELYLEMVALTGRLEAPRLGGPGPVLDYAVVMRRFAQQDQLDAVLAREQLTPELIDAFAASLARLHDLAPPATPRSRHGGPAEVRAACLENLQWLAGEPGPWRAGVERLGRWTGQSLRRLAPRLRARRRQGRVRECHGDLHLANLVLHEGRVLAFDCIEFSDRLRVIDVMSDLAFLVMDLDAHGAHGAAGRLLNGYLSAGGDYDGLRVLRLYLVYRALVRAKVSVIRAGQSPAQAERRAARQRASAQVRLALAYAAGAPPALLLTRGVSGSGKSTLASALVERLGCVQVRSDVERKRLAGLGANQRSRSGLRGGLYTEALSRRTYARLLESARAALEGGFSVVVDATFLRAADRADFLRLAAQLGAPCLLLDLQARSERLRARVRARERAGRDASEATLEVLEHQLRSAEPLTQAERALSLPVDADAPFDLDRLERAIGRRLGAPLPDPR